MRDAHRSRRAHGFWRPLALTALLAGLGGPAAAQPSWQPVASIRSAAERVVADQSTAAAEASVDPRVRMAACDRPLEARSMTDNRDATTVTVRVRCAEPAWTLYVPVRMRRQQTVVEIKRAMGRGEVIGPADVVERVRTQTNGYAYIGSQAQAIGQRLTRPAPAGTALTPAWIEAPLVVERGQRVTLVAIGAGLRIRAPGRALNAGGAQQRIRVENLSSGRVVEAVVRSSDVVEVAF